jgi:hypothetical protein
MVTNCLYVGRSSQHGKCQVCPVAEIEVLMQRLKQNRTQVLVAIDSIENRPDSIDCADNRLRVLDRLRGKGVVASRREPARDA